MSAPEVPISQTGVPAASTRASHLAPIIIAGIFFVLAMIQVSSHIMWRDEIRTWQVCAPCTGLISLWHAMRYEGVPVLWYWIVFGLTRITSNPFAMQFVHVMIATATVYIVARWSPFSLPARIIFGLGYFPFFEYAAITRNYALVFLLLLIACVLISRPGMNWPAMTIMMFLLTQVSIWGAGLAGLMMLAAIAKALWVPRAQWPPIWKPIVAAGVVLIGVGLCFVEVLPGPGGSFTGTWFHASQFERFLGAFQAVYRGWIPIPSWSAHFWNTNILDTWFAPTKPEEFDMRIALQASLGAMLLLGAAMLLWHRPIAGGVLIMGTVALMGFEFMFRGAARHHGHFFMLLIVACWLAQTTPALRSRSAEISSLIPRLDRTRGPALTAILVVNAIAGIAAAVAGIVLPFSASRAAATYIQKNVDPQVNLFGIPDYCISPVAQLLRRPIYFPQMRKLAFYNTQNDGDRFPVDAESTMRDAIQQILTTRHDVLMIFASEQQLADHDIEQPIGTGSTGQRLILRIKVLDSFQSSVVEDESIRLYQLSILQDQPAGLRLGR